MSDVIQDAKRLLEGTTPGPWVTGGKDESGNIYIGNPSEYGNLVATSGICDADLIAAAPELAQTLAEETYFYGVQVWMGGRWIMMLTSNYGTSLMYRGKWFERKDEAEECAAKWNHDTPTRIVRQRRSPVEEIE